MEKYLTTLKKHFGFDSFREKQVDIIKGVLEDKKDVCVIMFTGSGKSLCYQFPAFHTKKTVLVITPLISLMNDQQMKMKENACCLNSTVNRKSDLKYDILKNKYRVVYTTPEYLITQEEFIRELDSKDVLVAVAIDEAHCTSAWGNDFRPAYKQLSCLKKWLEKTPIIALTATATTKVKKDIIKILDLYNPLIVQTTFDRPNLIIKVFPKTSAAKDLVGLIKAGEPTIIYCQTRKMTEDIAELLKDKKILTGHYHAGMNASDREDVHNQFAAGETSCIVATIAFGMGIDCTIRKVIHYGIPKDMESYYQEIGRAGRDGKESECILFYSLKDINTNNYLINQISNSSYRSHMIDIALMMKNYIYSNACRRKFILEYFGEVYQKDNCATCDNCLNSKKVTSYNFAKDAALLLQVMILTNNTYGATILRCIIRGSNNKKVPKKFKKSNLFGKGSNHTEKWWQIFVTMMANSGYIKEKAISGGQGFTLSTTPKGVSWLDEYKKNNSTELILQVPDDMLKLLPLVAEKETTNEKSLKIDYESDNDLDEAVKKEDINDFEADMQSDLNNDEEEKEEQPEKKSKNKKPTKLDKVYELLKKKTSINDIAKQLDVKKRTVENYIIKLIEQEYKLELKDLGFTDEVRKTINDKIKELNNPEELKTIKDSLPRSVSYLHIRMALNMDGEKEKEEDSDDEEIEEDKETEELEREMTKSDKEKVYKLLKKKMSIDAIASELNVNKTIIEDHITTEYLKLMETHDQ